MIREQTVSNIDGLMEAVRQLDESELDRLVRQTLSLRAKRRAPSLSETESELLQKINRGIPPEIQERYDHLRRKLRSGRLTEEEHGELIGLTDEIEHLAARRAAHLTMLAKLRGVSLGELMSQLGLESPGVA